MRYGGIFFAVFLLFRVLGTGIFAQETQAAGEISPVFAPFISRLSAEVKNNLVRLSWIDSPDTRGPVYIYRSASPITEISVDSRLRLVEVPYGVQFYIDEAEEPGTFYYFAAAGDEAGQRYNIIIPFNNSISVAVKPVETESPGSQGSALSGIPAQTGGAPVESKIFALEAAVQGDGVVISYRTMHGTKNAILYRSVQPLRRTTDLLGAVIVQSGITSPFTDYPVPGIPYYYAVILEDDITAGNAEIFPGYNATLTVAEVPVGKFRVGLPSKPGNIRSMPLPLISLHTAAPGSLSVSEIPTPRELSPAAAKAVAGLKVPVKKGPALKNPRAFNEDLETPASGEEYTLRSIVQGPFVQRDWTSAREELVRFLSLPRSDASEARARFYLGQTYYFSKFPREALFEFLFIRTRFPAEAAEWIQAALAELTSP
jgi:hypothetical protein